MSYEAIMGQQDDGGADALGLRLVAFRRWLSDEARCTVHPSVCIVNGEATDGTKNAPVLLFGPPPSASSASQTSSTAAGAVANAAAGPGRCGMIDRDADRVLYDRTMGCQVRAARELKKDEVMMSMPRFAMITPDLVASSDAGRAVLACCQPPPSPDGAEAKVGRHPSPPNYWDVFENTTIHEKRYAERFSPSSGTQLLVKILQERKKAEKVLAEAERAIAGGEAKVKLVRNRGLSTRAPVLAFLLHQRFLGDERPPVRSEKGGAYEQQDAELRNELGEVSGKELNALDVVIPPSPPPDAPTTYGPYARTLPSSVSLPICWKRNELALLAGCIPGTLPLQEVAARTMQLSSELISLVEAGLLHRFPDIFPPGLITWDRWVWAASVFTSRVLPASCYLNKKDGFAADHKCSEGEQFYSPPDVWDELGVLVPLLDMLNHETESSQITWMPPPGESDTEAMDEEDEDENENSPDPHIARAIVHKRVKKGCQVYTNYGEMSNHNMILQYGFAQINNQCDDVGIGWGLMDAVGNVSPPADYDVSLESGSDGDESANDRDSRYLVYESIDPIAINQWWTESRLAMLGKQGLLDEKFMLNLRAGRKMNALAHSNGTFHPIFLTAAAVATMPPQDLENHCREDSATFTLTKRHQRILRRYLIFVFTRKLEKLLQSLNNGLKAHFNFNNAELWTKATSGGLQYVPSADSGGGAEETPAKQGWQTFFDSYAYSTSMEVEKRYYAMGSDSCVLTLYDGHLRSLQASIDGAASKEKFIAGALKQLEDLGIVLSDDEGAADDDDAVMEEESSGVEAKTDSQHPPTSNGSAPPAPSQEQSSASPKNRRNRKKGERPPAIKLHIGNLSYQTTPAELFDFFAGMYGRENVLECHIPTERDTNKSRGFGFVTMPEAAAVQALQSDRQHEIEGRLLKVAESNTAGSGRSQGSASGGTIPSDRCATCGYRPKYCTCPAPNIPGGQGMMGGGFSGGPPFPPDDMYGPPVGGPDPYYDRPAGDYDYDYDRRHRSQSWNRGRPSDSRSRSPRSSRGRGSYHRERDSRYYDRGHRDYREGRSYSRSRSRDRGRDRERRDRDRGRGGDRDRDSRSGGRHGSSRGWGTRSSRSSRYSRSRSRSHSRSRSRSYGKSAPSRRGGDRERKSSGGSASDPSALPRGGRSRSRSRSASLPPPQSRDSGGRSGGDKKREGKSRNRSRSRSRGRSGRRKRSSKGSHRKESKRSRSRSFD